MNFEKYKNSEYTIYSDFAEVVAAILEVAIKEAPYPYRFQPIQWRAKTPESLHKKIHKRENIDPERIEEDIKDLAGCRLVFYTNDDVSRFLGSGILRANFDIDFERTKHHHPVPGQTDPSNQYRGDNIVVRLNADRARLPEYARFEGLSCEVQVQTILNHAWSETAHDIIYKLPKLSGFGEKRLQTIDEQLQRIMKKYLLPAGHEFQKVWNDYQKLLEGKDLVDTGALEELQRSEDNNIRKELLERIRDYQLPHYDDLRAAYPDLRTKIVDSVQEARNTKPQQIEVPGGSFDGVTIDEYLGLVTDILERYRYVDVEGTFDSVCQLYQEAANEQERNRLLQLASTLSAHNLNVWQQAGPYVQHVLIGKLQHLDAEKLEMLRAVAINIIQGILDTTVRGTSSTYDTVTFKTGAVTPSDQLTKIRKEALSIAKKLYNAARSQQEKRNVIGVFSEAARLPHMGQYSDALVREVLSDAADIVEFYTEIAPSEDFEILQAIEYDLLWWYRWRRGITDKVVSDPTVFEQRDRLLEKIQRFRSVIDGNEQFIKFKTLVGYESVFPPTWDDDEFEVKGEDAYRTKCIEAYVEQITNANADDWFRFIQLCAKTISNDLATFRFFGEFLDRVGAHRDEVAFTYLDKIDGEFAWILPSLLNGIAKSDRKLDVKKKITEWIESGKFLRQIAQHFRWTSSLDVGLLRRLQDKAISRSDEDTVLACLEAVLGRQEEAIDELEETIIHPAFRFLTTHQNVNWINLGWYLATNKSVLASASSETIDIVLKNLIYVQRINHRSERILATLANKLPEKVRWSQKIGQPVKVYSTV